MSTTTQRYNQSQFDAVAMGEYNDCSVIALSVALDIPYDQAHKRLKEKGRKDRDGATIMQILDCIKKRSRLYYDPRQKNGSRYTLKTIGRKVPEGRYLVFTRHHVAALVDGLIYDWARDSKRRIKYIVKVAPE